MLQAMLQVKVDGIFGTQTENLAESISEKCKAHSRRDLRNRNLEESG